MQNLDKIEGSKSQPQTLRGKQNVKLLIVLMSHGTSLMLSQLVDI